MVRNRSKTNITSRKIIQLYRQTTHKKKTNKNNNIFIKREDKRNIFGYAKHFATFFVFWSGGGGGRAGKKHLMLRPSLCSRQNQSSRQAGVIREG